jgi:hypothetical protein
MMRGSNAPLFLPRGLTVLLVALPEIDDLVVNLRCERRWRWFKHAYPVRREICPKFTLRHAPFLVPGPPPATGALACFAPKACVPVVCVRASMREWVGG